MYRRWLDGEVIIAPPATDTSPRLTTDFDTKMVIILAALLCSLIVIAALGLNSIIRCTLRFRRRFGLESQEEAAATTGLKKEELRRIPVEIFGSGGEGAPETDCPICLGEIVNGEKVRVLPKCNHGFHVRCIDTWLGSHSSCPTCRRSLIEHKPAGSISGSGGYS